MVQGQAHSEAVVCAVVAVVEEAESGAGLEAEGLQEVQQQEVQQQQEGRQKYRRLLQR